MSPIYNTIRDKTVFDKRGKKINNTCWFKHSTRTPPRVHRPMTEISNMQPHIIIYTSKM